MLNGTTYIVRPRMQPRKSPSRLLAHLGRVHPVVRRSGVLFALRADEGAVLDPGDVGRIGRGPVAAGPLLGVELDEGAGVDELAAERLELGVGAVEPVDGVRLDRARTMDSTQSRRRRFLVGVLRATATKAGSRERGNEWHESTDRLFESRQPERRPEGTVLRPTWIVGVIRAVHP